MEYTELLKELPLFAGIAEEEIPKLCSAFGCRTRRIEREACCGVRASA